MFFVCLIYQMDLYQRTDRMFQCMRYATMMSMMAVVVGKNGLFTTRPLDAKTGLHSNSGVQESVNVDTSSVATSR
jgi:hypothetical protein